MEKNGKKPAASSAEKKAARAAASAAKSAAKQAKANRGYVKAGPLVGLILLTGGSAVFGLVFMNPLLERGVEAGLEAAFGARAEVEGLRFRPFRMRLSVDAVSVADAAAPMTDLFRTGRLEVRLSPSAALRGKVYVEEASAASIELGAARKTSGALPGAPEPEPRTKRPAPEIPALVDWEAFDAEALLEREKSKLAAPAAYEAAGKAYAEAVDRWKGRRETSAAAVDKARASSKAVLAIDVKAIRTAGEAARALALVKAAAADVRSVGTEAKAVAEGVRSDSAALDRLAREARSAADRDAAYLRSLVTPGSGAARAALEPAVRALLTDKAETGLYYGGRFLEAASRFRDSGSGEAAAPGAGTDRPAFRGRDVVFPGAAFPRFRLGLLASSFKAGDSAWYVELRELSSDPDRVPGPSSLKLEVRRGGSLVRADARADLRRSAGGAWEAGLTLAHLPFDLGDALAGAGLSGFSGVLEGASELRGGPGGFTSVLETEVRNPVVAAPSGSLGRAAADALRRAGAVNLRAEYEAAPDGKDTFSLSSDLDRIIAAAVESEARRYAARASRDLDTALREYVGRDLEGLLAPGKEFEVLAKGAEGDSASATSLEKSLDGKQSEVEARSKALGSDLLKGVTVPKIGP